MAALAQKASHPSAKDGWITAYENWMDRRGKGAWLAAMILGFVFFWLLGLALLFYMIWSNRMFSKSHTCSRENLFIGAMPQAAILHLTPVRPTPYAGLMKSNYNLKPS